jgi:hypothetical protein
MSKCFSRFWNFVSPDAPTWPPTNRPGQGGGRIGRPSVCPQAVQFQTRRVFELGRKTASRKIVRACLTASPKRGSRFGGLGVDSHLKFGRQLNRKLRRLGATEDAIDIGARDPIGVCNAGAIADETALVHECRSASDFNSSADRSGNAHKIARRLDAPLERTNNGRRLRHAPAYRNAPCRSE